MTTHRPPNTSGDGSPNPAVSMQGVASLAIVGAKLLELAGRTSLELETAPADDRYDQIQHAVQEATDAARYATELIVEAHRAAGSGSTR